MGFHILNFSFSTAFSIPTKDQALVKIEKFIRWLNMQPFVKKFTSRRLHLDNDTVPTDFWPFILACSRAFSRVLTP